MAQIFISYRRKNWPFTQPLVKDLRARLEAKVYIDLDSIDNVEFERSILPNLRQSDVVLLIVSEHTFDAARIHRDDDWVRREIREAMSHNIPIILVSVEGLLPSSDLPKELQALGRYQAVKFYPEVYDACLNRLVEFVAKAIPAIKVRETLPPVTQTQPVPRPKPGPELSFMSMLLGIGSVSILAAVLFFIVQSMTQTIITPLFEPTRAVLVDPDRPTATITKAASDTPSAPTPNATELEQTIEADMGQIQVEATQTWAGFQTSTATLWTPVPTIDVRATAEVRLAQTITQTWIEGWTNTPTLSPTLNATQIIETLEAIGVTRNDDWTPVEREVDGVVMVLVPAGCFMMGSTIGDSDERPVHETCIEKPFWLDKTEVTQAQFAANGGMKANSNAFNGDNRPVEQITWFEAEAYCREQRGGRLPTEAEWEFAARGPDGLVYPWGYEFIAENVVYSQNSNRQTAEVGSRPGGESWVGALDLSGNVWEWV
ncbi:MAG: SUMF1/EgtB/PvdO family nonheme iron enzyme, partial [Anaerolineae bacterium]|nr:SUMF1/EgtB/PvdO family nonheme iron enzyme [Anaerolineae bacterium]